MFFKYTASILHVFFTCSSSVLQYFGVGLFSPPGNVCVQPLEGCKSTLNRLHSQTLLPCPPLTNRQRRRRCPLDDIAKQRPAVNIELFHDKHPTKLSFAYIGTCLKFFKKKGATLCALFITDTAVYPWVLMLNSSSDRPASSC